MEMRESVRRKKTWRGAATKPLERLYEELQGSLEKGAERRGLFCLPCGKQILVHDAQVIDAVSNYIQHLQGDAHRKVLHHSIGRESPEPWQSFRLRTHSPGTRELWFHHLDGHMTYDRQETTKEKRMAMAALSAPRAGSPRERSTTARMRERGTSASGAGHGNGNGTMGAAFDEASALWEKKKQRRIDLSSHDFENSFDWRKWAATRDFADVLTAATGNSEAEAEVGQTAIDLSSCTFFFLVHHEAKDYTLEAKRYFAIADERDGIEVLFSKRTTQCRSLLFQASQSGRLLGRGSPRPSSPTDGRAILVQSETDVLLAFGQSNSRSRGQVSKARPVRDDTSMRRHVLDFLATLTKKPEEDLLALVRRHSSFGADHHFHLQPALWKRWLSFLQDRGPGGEAGCGHRAAPPPKWSKPPPTRPGAQNAQQPEQPAEIPRADSQSLDEIATCVQDAARCAKDQDWGGLWRCLELTPKLAGPTVQASRPDVAFILYCFEGLKEAWYDEESARLWVNMLEKGAASLAAERA